jgi:hypothetical protein
MERFIHNKSRIGLMSVSMTIIFLAGRRKIVIEENMCGTG